MPFQNSAEIAIHLTYFFMHILPLEPDRIISALEVLKDELDELPIGSGSFKHRLKVDVS